MSLQTLSEWLRCPNCFCPLVAHGPLTLTCAAGHSFDVNKRGFVSLLHGSHKLIGDNAAMLDARDFFLGAGWYEPLRDALTIRIAAEAPSRVLDVGCGTGYYLRDVMARGEGTRALALDLSPMAVARTVRGLHNVDGLVADVWSKLPVRDAAADVILNVFAPRNAGEFHRVLKQDALLVVVIPQGAHLQELRDADLALDVHPGKAIQLIDTLKPYFTLESRRSFSTVMGLSLREVKALIGMGPSAHHKDAGRITGDDQSRQSVTAALELFSFRRSTRGHGV